MISAVLIDDDSNLREGMKVMLSSYAPEITVLGEAESVESGVKLIEEVRPEIIFLDIMIIGGTGFDILEQLNQRNANITAHIIFVTAHEKFAIKAFRFSALDFLLKPVDPEDLQEVIKKIKNITTTKDNDYKHIELLLDNMSRKKDSFKKIALSNSDGIHLFEIQDIIRCESEDNYTKFYFRDHKPLLISRTLKEYEELLTDHSFERIHQSHLINVNELKSYIKKDGGFVVMSDNSKLPVSQRKKDKLQELIARF